MDLRVRPRLLAVLGGVALAGALAGCASQAPAGPVESPTPTPTVATPTPTPSPSSTPTPTPTAGSAATPIGFGCDALLSLQGVYDLNPNLSIVPDPAPPAGTFAATLVRELGVACDLVHNSNGAVLHVAAARPGSDALAALRAAATTVVDLGVGGFEAFDTGDAILAFRGDLVLSAEDGDYFGGEELAAALRTAIDSID